MIRYPQQCSKTPGDLLKFLVHPHTGRPNPSHGYSIQNYFRKSGQQKNTKIDNTKHQQLDFCKSLPNHI